MSRSAGRRVRCRSIVSRAGAAARRGSQPRIATIFPPRPAGKDKEGFRIQTTKGRRRCTGRGGRRQRRPRRPLRRRPAAARAADDARARSCSRTPLNLASSPRYPLRGHQLGYRPKTNSYDAWDLAQWERYIRELAVFGTNAIELIPPRSDDAADSPHFPLPPLEMMAGMSRICADYGLDVWIWYPAMDADYADPRTVEHALTEWAEVFQKLPRIDAVFVPGGDPGHTRPKVLMALLEKQAANLRRFHPERPDVGLAAELLPGMARRVPRAWCEPSPPGWAASCTGRRCASACPS